MVVKGHFQFRIAAHADEESKNIRTPVKCLEIRINYFLLGEKQKKKEEEEELTDSKTEISIGVVASRAWKKRRMLS